jgi:hypothetical protein
LATIPVLSASYSLGQSIREFLTMFDNVTLSLTSNTTIAVVPTFNVLCTTLQGDAANTVVAGAQYVLMHIIDPRFPSSFNRI